MKKQKERVFANGEGLKKGPWTADEDAMLVEYVKSHGEKQWNLVQKMGLRRCGKSCRLRWTNHLRPDLKKGAFSSDEEKIVIELHRRLGNKWSKIAAKLPGRTDNEVKNFWNTKIKRRLKNGPLEIFQKNNNADSIQPAMNFQAPLFAPVNMDPNLNPDSDPLLNQSTTLCFNHPGNASSPEQGMNLVARDLIFHQSVPSNSLFSVSEELMSFYQNPNPFQWNNFQLEFETNPFSHHVNALPYAGSEASYGIQSTDGEPEMMETNTNALDFHYGDFSAYLLGDEGRDYYSPSLGVENVSTRIDEGYQNLESGGEMSSLLVGNDGSVTDATIGSPCGLSSSESLGKRLLEVELESMDDELSSLLDTFSASGLPPDWYQTSGGDGLLEGTLTSYDSQHHDPITLSSEPAAASETGHVLEH